MKTITEQLADALRVVSAGNTDCENLQEIARNALAAYDAQQALVSALRGCVERLGVAIESDTDNALHGASPDDVAAYEAGRAALEAAGVPNA